MSFLHCPMTSLSMVWQPWAIMEGYKDGPFLFAGAYSAYLVVALIIFLPFLPRRYRHCPSYVQDVL